MNHDGAMGLLQRGQDGAHVEGGEAAQVDDLERDVLAFSGFGRVQREADGRSIGDHRRARSFARHPGTADRDLELRVDFFFHVVTGLWFEKDHRIGVGDGRSQQGVGV